MEEIRILSTQRCRFLKVLLSGFERPIVIDWRRQAQYEATVTVLALQRWFLEKGHYPEDLTTLVVAGYLDHLPVDPYAADGLRYEIRENGFILYSVGADFDDDSGIDNEEGWGEGDGDYDEVFWPVRWYDSEE